MPPVSYTHLVPIAFGLWLYLKGYRNLYLHFSMVFLFVNLIGFAGYYLHPAAPPWYAINYGFEPILDTPGNVAGLGRFDTLTGLSIFDSIYGRNANVFAAVPSLHAAYMVVALCYAIVNKCNKFVIILFAIIMAGIWGTAVYTSHHYIIDVTLGICCALLGILLFEKGLMKMCIRDRAKPLERRVSRSMINLTDSTVPYSSKTCCKSDSLTR